MRSGDAEETERRRRAFSALKETFRPEFINRVDEVIIFQDLSLDNVKLIVDLQMREVRARLAEYNLEVTLTDAAKQWLAEHGYDPQYGARPLRRVIQRYIENPLSIQLLQGKFDAGAHIEVDYESGENLEFRTASDAES